MIFLSCKILPFKPKACAEQASLRLIINKVFIQQYNPKISTLRENGNLLNNGNSIYKTYSTC